jgi:hypothetical protein
MGPSNHPCDEYQQHCPAVINQIDVSSSLISGVNAARHLACSLPRGATLAFRVVCSPATTMALAPRQRFFSFELFERHHTHMHTVFLIT